MVRLKNGMTIHFVACQKNIDVNARVTTYCMLPVGHAGDCVPEPSVEMIEQVLIQMYQKGENHAK